MTGFRRNDLLTIGFGGGVYACFERMTDHREFPLFHHQRDAT